MTISKSEKTFAHCRYLAWWKCWGKTLLQCILSEEDAPKEHQQDGLKSCYTLTVRVQLEVKWSEDVKLLVHIILLKMRMMQAALGEVGGHLQLSVRDKWVISFLWLMGYADLK